LLTIFPVAALRRRGYDDSLQRPRRLPCCANSFW
jgi:hypothetical protein